MIKRLLILLSIFTFSINSAAYASGNSAPNLQIPIMSDVHINLNNASNERNFINALKEYKQLAPNYQALAIVGDLTDQGLPEQYNRFNQLLNQYSNPDAEKILVMGNHEFYQGVYWPDPSYTDQMFIDRFVTNTNVPSLYYDKWVKGYHFITLGSEESKVTNPDNHDYVVLSDQQYQWLEGKLSEQADSNKPIFVFLHQPIDDTVYGSEEWGGNLRDGRLLNLLKQYPQVILFSGHLHYLLNHPRSVFQDGFTMANTGAIAYTLYEGGPGPDNSSQGLLVNVYDDKVEILAREFSTHAWVNQYTIKVPFEKTIDDQVNPYFPDGSSAAVETTSVNEAVISWDAAKDNTQVDKYLIMQNGQVVQTTYNLFWQDPNVARFTADIKNLEPNQDYNFDIVAVDSWKNQSEASLKIDVKTNRVSGWYKDGNNNYYYYDPATGKKVTGWLFNKNYWYYLNSKGIMQTGWVKYGTKWYYFGTYGEMKIGWIKDKGSYYYLSSSGVMQTGWILYRNQWYYLSSDGQMQTGWVKYGTHWYYLDSNGAMKIGWLYFNKNWYYLDKSGFMKTGWLQYASNWYYLFNDGKMAYNTKIGSYKLGKDGAWIH